MVLAAAWILLPGSKTVHAESLTLPSDMKLTFSSGIGAWSTELSLKKNGKFSGYYHDSNLGETGDGYPDGTVYYCKFSGRFDIVKKVGSKKYKLQLKKIKQEEESGKKKIEDDILYIAAAPYGLDGGKNFTLYCPGFLTKKLPQEALTWSFDIPEKLEGYALYNKKKGYTFFQYWN